MRFKSLVMVLLASVLVTGCGDLFSAAGRMKKDAIVTAEKELTPSALLRKYEWFKNALASLDKKRNDIKVFEARLAEIEALNVGTPRNQWSRIDLEASQQARTELAGVKGSYNLLAAEYNAQMAKINWRFTNVGGLPQGHSETLPREVAEYVGK